ncbi:MAG: hypothetical protein AABW89_03815 [Nanoarchaeota archaeon]
MEFPNTIGVKGKILDPLAGEIKLSPRLELTVKDLREVEREIQERYRGKLDLSGDGIITIDNRAYERNFLELFQAHNRTIHSRDRPEKPSFAEVIAVKGAGLLGWSKYKPFVNNEGLQRRYPIVMRDGVSLNSHRIWGGISRKAACFQYVNALILNALIKRQDISQATYFSLRVVALEELLLEENGEIRRCSMDDYCNDSFRPPEFNVRLPKKEETCEFAQLFYVGDTLDCRVVPETFKWDD